MGKSRNLNFGRSTPALGGFQSFAGTHADGKVAPIAVAQLAARRPSVFKLGGPLQVFI
jgi:hypothetical protein